MARRQSATAAAPVKRIITGGVEGQLGDAVGRVGNSGKTSAKGLKLFSSSHYP